MHSYGKQFGKMERIQKALVSDHLDSHPSFAFYYMYGFVSYLILISLSFSVLTSKTDLIIYSYVRIAGED